MDKQYISKIRPYLEELQELSPIATPAVAKLSPCKAKAVIFDIYGTLIISASGDVDHAEYDASMIKKAFSATNIEILDNRTEAIDSIHTYFNQTIKAHKEQGKKEGRPFPEVNILDVWKDTLACFKEKKIISYTEMPDLYLLTFVFELQTNKVWPMPNMKSTLDSLGKSNLELGIISNAQFYTPVIMNYFMKNKIIEGRELPPFDKDITVYSFEELRCKPDVSLFEMILAELKKKGISARETAFVGNDMLKDMWTAKQAGVQTIFYAGDERAYRLHENDERTKDLIPDYTITDLKQLLEILQIEE